MPANALTEPNYGNPEPVVWFWSVMDGLWFWPDRESYEYDEALLKIPKQPQFLGNVFDSKN